MTCRVRLFARVRDLVGADTVILELPPSATVAELRRALAAAHPSLAGLLQRCAVAVNAEFATDEQRLSPEAEVGLLPPVSGG